MEPLDRERLARVDENIKILMKYVPKIHKLEQDSAINKQHHRLAMWMVGVVASPALIWVCKKLGAVI